jgi:hypothetical protein
VSCGSAYAAVIQRAHSKQDVILVAMSEEISAASSFSNHSLELREKVFFKTCSPQLYAPLQSISVPIIVPLETNFFLPERMSPL